MITHDDNFKPSCPDCYTRISFAQFILGLCPNCEETKRNQLCESEDDPMDDPMETDSEDDPMETDDEDMLP